MEVTLELIAVSQLVQLWLDRMQQVIKHTQQVDRIRREATQIRINGSIDEN